MEGASSSYQSARAPGRRFRLADAGGISLCAAWVVVVCRWVSEAERGTFYYWDYGNFEDLAGRTCRAFGSSWLEGWRFLTGSLSEDYNALFAVPLLPFLGERPTRFRFILGLGLAYLLPLALALGSLAARLVPRRERQAFWATVAVCLTTPALWVTVMRGYPDVGAALLIALAARLYLERPALDRPLQILGIGLLLAGAALFRRHFLFAVTAFHGAVALVLFAAEWERRRETGQAARIAGAVWRLCGLGASTALMLTVIGFPFVARILRRDFYSLYASYLSPWHASLGFYLGLNGAAAWVLALAGLALGARRPALFLLSFGALSLAQWSAIVRQISEVYTVHFTPTLVLGLGCFLASLAACSRASIRVGASVLACGLVAVNLVLGLSPADLVAGHVPGRTLFAENSGPLTQDGREGLLELVAELRRTASPGDPILVAASSARLNAGLVAAADRALPGTARLRVIETPDVDSRDWYPVDALLEARLVVVALPVQHHLPPEEQHLVTVVVDLFRQGAGTARDFVRLPRAITLARGVEAHVYRRRRPSSLATGIETLAFVRAAVQERPGNQADWVIVGQVFPSWAQPRADGATSLWIHPGRLEDGTQATALFLTRPEPPLWVSGRIGFEDARCLGARLTAQLTDRTGRPIAQASFLTRPGGRGDFALELPPAPAAEQLRLEASNRKPGASIDYCMLRVDPLRVASGSAGLPRSLDVGAAPQSSP
jgi:hypothetical protein